MVERRIAALLTAGSLAFAGNVSAQPYLTLGITQAEAKLDGTASRESSRPTVGAGYRFTEHLALEASYLRLGNHGAWTAKGAGLAAVGTLPMGRWSLLGKVGIYSLESERTVAASGGPSIGTTTSEGLGNRAVLGIGAGYSLSERLQVRAMLEQVDGKGELDSLRLFTLGAVVGF
jgi:hypothetical protein